MSELAPPVNWRDLLLGEVATCTLGGTPSTEVPLFWGGPIPWMASGDVNLKRVHDVPGRITEAGLAASNATLVDPPAVAVGLAGQGRTRGTVALTLSRLCTNQSIALLKGRDELLTTFLFYNLERRFEELRARSSGGGRGGLSKGILEKVPLSLPSLPEQSKIAEILDTLDAAIRGTEAVVAKLRAMKQGLLHDLLTRGIDANGDLRPPQPEAPHLYHQTPLGWLPKEWDCTTLGNVIASIDSGWSPACIETPPVVGEWGVLKVSAVTRGFYDDQQAKTLPSVLKPRPSLEVRNGDVILTRANGVAELVGKTVQVQNTQNKLMLSDKLLRLVPDKRKMTNDFLALLMTSDCIVRQIEKSMSGSSGQKNISQSQIRAFECFTPSVDEQKDISSRVAAFEARASAEEKVLNKLRLQKSGLMDDLLTGRVPVMPLL